MKKMTAQEDAAFIARVESGMKPAWPGHVTLSEAAWLALLRRDGAKLYRAPRSQQTEAMCLTAVRQHGWALEYVGKQTAEICRAAVRQSGWALQYVDAPTPELCSEAVRQFPGALRHVPAELQTEELCLDAVLASNGDALCYVEKQTHAICEAALRQCGRLFVHVRELTPELAVIAARCPTACPSLILDEVPGLGVYLVLVVLLSQRDCGLTVGERELREWFRDYGSERYAELSRLGPPEVSLSKASGRRRVLQ